MDSSYVNLDTVKGCYLLKYMVDGLDATSEGGNYYDSLFSELKKFNIGIEMASLFVKMATIFADMETRNDMVPEVLIMSGDILPNVIRIAPAQINVIQQKHPADYKIILDQDDLFLTFNRVVSLGKKKIRMIGKVHYFHDEVKEYDYDMYDLELPFLAEFSEAVFSKKKHLFIDPALDLSPPKIIRAPSLPRYSF